MFGNEAGPYLFHYTTLATAIEHILPTLSFRLSPFSQMRDPRESHAWLGSAGKYGSKLPNEDELFFEFSEHLMSQKPFFKVMSLTRDDRRPPPNEIFGRGFARPRLWEQYGGNHRGVCLCFDRDALIQCLEPELQKVGELHHGDVVYEDEPIAHHVLYFDMNEAAKRGISALVDELLRTHADELFFKKLCDWSTEYEYRFVVRTKSHDPIVVSIAPALRGIVLGELVSSSYFPAVRALCDPHGIAITQLRWVNGRPIPLPLPK
jgi:Protein of unknown function (DUF2971)